MIPLWKILQSELTLTEKDIHVWRADLDLPTIGLQNLYQTLSTDERMRAERFHFVRDRNRFIVRRGILRKILGCYLGAEPSTLQFSYGKDGKPMLADIFARRTIHFNLSKSEGLALFAFTQDREIGVDIERVRDIPEMDEIAERFFSVKENSIFRALPKSKKKEAFFKCWTSKEAFMKATGEGLSRSLGAFEVSLAPGERVALISTTGDFREASCWSIHELDFGESFAAALSVEGHRVQFEFKQMDMRLFL